MDFGGWFSVLLAKLVGHQTAELEIAGEYRTFHPQGLQFTAKFNLILGLYLTLVSVQ